MGHKEYSVTNIIDILRRAKAKDSFRRIARSTGIDRNTIRNYLRLAATHGFDDSTFDPEVGRNRVLHALGVTLVQSRYQYVYLTHRQDLNALISGMEEAWSFFSGITKRLILDNMKAAVVKR